MYWLIRKIIEDDVLLTRGQQDIEDNEIPDQKIINPFAALSLDNIENTINSFPNYEVETLADMCINSIRDTSHTWYSPIYLQAVIKTPGNIAEKIVGDELLLIGETIGIKIGFNVVDKTFVMIQGTKKIVSINAFNIMSTLILSEIKPGLFSAYTILLNWLCDYYTYFYYDSESFDIIHDIISARVIDSFAWMQEEKKYWMGKYLRKKRSREIGWKKNIQKHIWSFHRKNLITNKQEQTNYINQVIKEELELLT